jgi:hypothetical protein
MWVEEYPLLLCWKQSGIRTGMRNQTSSCGCRHHLQGRLPFTRTNTRTQRQAWAIISLISITYYHLNGK